MKNILIIHHVSSLGGGTKSLIDMAIMLKKDNDVTICIPQGSKEIIKMAQKYAIRCYEVETPIPSFNLYSGMSGVFNRYTISRLLRFRNNKKLVTELMKLSPDVIFYNTTVTSLIAKDVPDSVKNICIVRETFINSIFNKFYRDNFEKKFVGVAYIANHEKNYLKLKGPKQIVIPDCLEPKNIQLYDQEILKEKYGLTNRFCSLFMGGMTQIKGLDIALKAAENLDETYCLLIAGEINRDILSAKYILKHMYNIKYVSFLFSVKRRLDKLIDCKKVILLGYLKDISESMNMCDVVIFPSTAAHQPRPCIEAGEFKKPVILSDYEATKEYFINNYNALTFKPKDGLDLARKIEYLAKNKGVRERLGIKNYRLTKEKHNYMKTQNLINDFFKEVLK